MSDSDPQTIDSLQRLLRESYTLVQPEISLIRAGGDGNHTYKIASNESLFIARIYGSQALENPNWARYELEMLVHLATKGVSVAAPIPGFDGELLYFLPNSNGSPMPTALFNFAEGGVEWPTSPARATLLGISFAELHRASDDFITASTPRIFDVERLLNKPLRLMRPFLKDSDPQDAVAWKTLLQTAESAQALLEKIPDIGGAFGSIHGDLHQGNCHFHFSEAGDRLQFFDFSNTGIGWRVYDLSGFLWPLRDDTIKNTEIKASCDAFIEGYRSVRPLLPEEEAGIIACVKARDFWEAGCWLEFGENLDPQTVRNGLHSYAEQFSRFPMSH